MSDVVTDEVKQAMDAMGWKLLKPSPARLFIHITWRRFRHVLFGCSRLPLMVWDERSGRLIATGTICDVCQQEFPMRGPTS